jgi:hypothetical protein
MALIFPNSTGQNGIYVTGTPNYVDVDSAYATLDEHTSFAASASAEGWSDGDIMTVYVKESATAHEVWLGQWDETNSRINQLIVEKDSVALVNGQPVGIVAVPSKLSYDKMVHEPRIFLISGTTHTTQDVNTGALHRCTSGSAVTVTLDTGAPVEWHGLFVQEGAGLVSFARGGSDTINGGEASVSILSRYNSAYVYQPTEGAWIITGVE